MLRLFGELVRFGGVGALATSVHIGVYVMTLTTLPPQAANALGFLAGVAISYVGHTWFSFAEASKQAGRSHALTARFLTVIAIGYGLNAGWVAFVTQGIGWSPAWAALLIAGITPVITFVLLKAWVYVPR
ncbi:GtrA family protein [Sulfitobacter sp. KE34]|uniref:GtrA family protein n=1 Tax=unclassified Sulfitobacter TaxID=196795 RepID=UPI0023E35113|nr:MULTISPECIES: GtrA family protein [unclassified Sulfitobacter]MDF3351834.1 GtrA family protein [Sulfitobacter sp. KE12]MDF3370187.1 GtrA family protein [Sulfitobacter sp. Ks43]MDF3377473.1 GtrA family protein [Sulfitobacter sp. KE37]MDF3395006.1 GtrA family protein [Sulfitobacter sp. Ks42]MDF3409066.1 GtrA family protein [Sulfitobacter sp. Ks39]MDF3456722.1 GtrA family protein [Sulfitobacter sp. M95]